MRRRLGVFSSWRDFGILQQMGTSGRIIWIYTSSSWHIELRSNLGIVRSRGCSSRDVLLSFCILNSEQQCQRTNIQENITWSAIGGTRYNMQYVQCGQVVRACGRACCASRPSPSFLFLKLQTKSATLSTAAVQNALTSQNAQSVYTSRLIQSVPRFKSARWQAETYDLDYKAILSVAGST